MALSDVMDDSKECSSVCPEEKCGKSEMLPKLYSEKEDEKLNFNLEHAKDLQQIIKQNLNKFQNNVKVVFDLCEKLSSDYGPKLWRKGSVRPKMFKQVVQMLDFTIYEIEDVSTEMVKSYKEFVMQCKKENKCDVGSNTNEDSSDDLSDDGGSAVFLPKNKHKNIKKQVAVKQIKKSKSTEDDLENGVESSETWYSEGNNHDNARKRNVDISCAGEAETTLPLNSSLADISCSTSEVKNSLHVSKAQEKLKISGENECSRIEGENEKNRSTTIVKEWLNSGISNDAMKVEESSDDYGSPSLVNDCTSNLIDDTPLVPGDLKGRYKDNSGGSSTDFISDSEGENIGSSILNLKCSVNNEENRSETKLSIEEEDELDKVENATDSKEVLGTRYVCDEIDNSCALPKKSKKSEIENERLKKRLLNFSSDESELAENETALSGEDFEKVTSVDEPKENIDSDQFKFSSKGNETKIVKNNSSSDSKDGDSLSATKTCTNENIGKTNLDLIVLSGDEGVNGNSVKKNLQDVPENRTGSTKVRWKVQGRKRMLSNTSSSSESETACEKPQSIVSNSSVLECHSDDDSSLEDRKQQGNLKTSGHSRECSSSEDENSVQQREIMKLTDLTKLDTGSCAPNSSWCENVKRKNVKGSKEESQSLFDFVEVSSEENEQSDDPGPKTVLPNNEPDDVDEMRISHARDCLERSSSSGGDDDTCNEKSSKEDGKRVIVKKERKVRDPTSCTPKREEISSGEDLEGSSSKSKRRKKRKKDWLLHLKLSENDSSDMESEEDAKSKKRKKKKKSIEIISKERKKSPQSSENEVVSVSSSDEFDLKKVKRQRQSSDESTDEEKKKRRKREDDENIISVSSSESDSDSDIQIISPLKLTPVKGRRKIKEIIEDTEVMPETRQATKEEEARRKRIAEKEKIFSQVFEASQSQGEVCNQLVLDIDNKTLKELVVVDRRLVVKLKPHQMEGVKFMWNACFETVEQTKKSRGSGCVLAHCMGLGKTFQVVTLVHTILLHKELNMKTVLILCPLSTVANWLDEFGKWLRLANANDSINIFVLRSKKYFERCSVAQNWLKKGGVMIMGYDLFRTLCSNGSKSNEIFRTAFLDSGPDVVICDEGHVLKNDKTALSKTMNKVKTQRRIVLTGTPLQNNLKEYYVMVQFVKPNLLGNKREFRNRFSNPISNGQYENSTPADVKLMKKRAHVLHKVLEGCIQRYEHSILTAQLPPKFEYALSVKLTDLQVKMYQYYLSNLARMGMNEKNRTATLFKDFHQLRKVSTHPRMLLMDLEWVKEGGALSSECELDYNIFSDNAKPKKKTNKKKNNDNASKNLENQGPPDWWKQFMIKGTEMEDIRESGKMSLLFSILDECNQIGDKVLVFSQSLITLNLIEYFLAKVTEAKEKNISDEKLEGHMGTWISGRDYYRLDGSTPADARAQMCKAFNRSENTRCRLFLISTRAGGLGINLYAANRVIIFDASWNPALDVQSIFRVYRYGQTKPCFFYRFIGEHTMEEKVYSRQVTKLSLSCRVVDEQQIERHYKFDDLQNMYNFDPTEEKRLKTPLVPKDIILAELLSKDKSWIDTYHEHDSLLENKEEEELDEDERKAAWEEFERERQGRPYEENGFAALLASLEANANNPENYLPQMSYENLYNQDPMAHLPSFYGHAYGAPQATSSTGQTHHGLASSGIASSPFGARPSTSGAGPFMSRAGPSTSGVGLSTTGPYMQGGPYSSKTRYAASPRRRGQTRGRGRGGPSVLSPNRGQQIPAETRFPYNTTASSGNGQGGQTNPSLGQTLHGMHPSYGRVVHGNGHMPGRGQTVSDRGQHIPGRVIYQHPVLVTGRGAGSTVQGGGALVLERGQPVSGGAQLGQQFSTTGLSAAVTKPQNAQVGQRTEHLPLNKSWLNLPLRGSAEPQSGKANIKTTDSRQLLSEWMSMDPKKKYNILFDATSKQNPHKPLSEIANQVKYMMESYHICEAEGKLQLIHPDVLQPKNAQLLKQIMVQPQEPQGHPTQKLPVLQQKGELQFQSRPLQVNQQSKQPLKPLNISNHQNNFIEMQK